MDELAILLRGLKVHAESYDNWTSQVLCRAIYSPDYFLTPNKHGMTEKRAQKKGLKKGKGLKGVLVDNLNRIRPLENKDTNPKP